MVRRDKALGPRWQHRMPVGRSLAGGIVAGLVAGAGMLLLAVLHSGLAGDDMSLPMKLIAAVWYGVIALLGDGGVVFAGLVTHFVVAAFFGALFGLTFGRLSSTRITIGVGLLYGVVVWAVMTWLVLPSWNETMAVRVALIPWWWLAYHVVFGSLVGLAPAFARSFTEVTRTSPITEPKEMPI